MTVRAAWDISAMQAPFLCSGLFQVKLFLFQIFKQLLTWVDSQVASRESTCNLTLSLVEAITGCLFST